MPLNLLGKLCLRRSQSKNIRKGISRPFKNFCLRPCRKLRKLHQNLANSFYQNQCDGVVVRASASQSVDLGFNPLVESYQKTLKKWHLQLPCLALGIYGRLWRTSRQVRLLCPWARHLTGCPTFMWKTGGP